MSTITESISGELPMVTTASLMVQKAEISNYSGLVLNRWALDTLNGSKAYTLTNAILIFFRSNVDREWSKLSDLVRVWTGPR